MDDYFFDLGHATFDVPSATVPQTTSGPSFNQVVGGGASWISSIGDAISNTARSVAGAYGQYRDAQLARDLTDIRNDAVKDLARRQPLSFRAQIPGLTTALSDQSGYVRQLGQALSGDTFVWLAVAGIAVFAVLKFAK